MQPHRTVSFKFSNDPDFAVKVRDIVGLSMNPPDKAIVLSVNEKTQSITICGTCDLQPLNTVRKFGRLFGN